MFSPRERDYLLDWVGENLTLVRQSAAGQRPMYWILGITFVVGLAAHAGGFLLKTSVTTEPLSLMADLLYALGWALWTGVILVLFVQIWPEAKRRQYRQALDAYEAAVGRQARAGSEQARTGPARKTHDFSSLWLVCARLKPVAFPGRGSLGGSPLGLR